MEEVLTKDQCTQLIRMGNEKGFTPALSNNQWKYKAGDPRKGDEFEFSVERRDAKIVMYELPELAALLWRNMKEHLKAAPLPDGWRVDHLNSYKALSMGGPTCSRDLLPSCPLNVNLKE